VVGFPILEFEGRKYPPLYTPRNETLIRLFDIIEDELKQLRTIVTEEEAEERHRQREQERRKESGSVERQTYLETAEQRRAQARLLRAKGLSIRIIAEEMGISKSQVHRYLD